MLSQLISKLESPQGFSSYRQIVEWLEQEWHVRVKYKTVYSLVPYKLGAKLKVPRPISSSQDEQAINLFKKTSPLPW
ncbi:winged helix-turn-helix domain-containing protein [Trichormus azollae]|uniref:winged helix-turn-helix domain-containing protein n=1 Tax=Trichormus azollae TaxID=1164 RepID=UPI0001957316